MTTHQIDSLIAHFDQLYYGIGFHCVDEKAASQKMKQAKDLGSRYAEAWCQLNSWEMDLDQEAAVAIFRELAEEGDSRAQAMLGWCIYYGQGAVRDENEPAIWFAKSSHPNGQYMLGWCYYFAKGVPKDLEKCVKLFKMAAEQGHYYAQRYAAYCLHYGFGCPIALMEALRFYRLACHAYPNFISDVVREVRATVSELDDRSYRAELLWELIHMDGTNADLISDFWTNSLPPLRLLAARAVVQAGESTDIFHEGIVKEVEVVGNTLEFIDTQN